MRALKTKIAILIIGIVFPSIIFAQTSEEIIAKHIAAHGGNKMIDQVNSIKILGKFTAFSEQKDFFCVKTKSGEYYSELYLGKYFVVEAFDGKTGWTIDPWQDISYARKINSAEENVFMQKSMFLTPFFDYKEKGNKIEFLGKENIEGVDVYTFKVIRKNRKEETWYLNSNTYLEYKSVTQWVDFARGIPAQTYYDDFKTVNGVVFPFYIERTFGQRNRNLQISSIEINPKFDKNQLVMPPKEQMKSLEFMKGIWDVKVEIMTRRNGWYQIGNTQSKIDYSSINVLQENINYETYFLINKRIDYTYNDGSKKYRIAILDDFSSSLEIFEGEINDTTFIIDNLNVRIGNDNNQSKEFTQYYISKVGSDGFIIEMKNSTDNGVSWISKERYTYSRKK